jgi:hypothetical protein
MFGRVCVFFVKHSQHCAQMSTFMLAAHAQKNEKIILAQQNATKIPKTLVEIFCFARSPGHK